MTTTTAACDEAWAEYAERVHPGTHSLNSERAAWVAAWERSTRHADDWACLRTDPDQYPLQQAHAVPTITQAVADVAILTELMAKGKS